MFAMPLSLPLSRVNRGTDQLFQGSVNSEVPIMVSNAPSQFLREVQQRLLIDQIFNGFDSASADRSNDPSSSLALREFFNSATPLPSFEEVYTSF